MMGKDEPEHFMYCTLFRGSLIKRSPGTSTGHNILLITAKISDLHIFLYIYGFTCEFS